MPSPLRASSSIPSPQYPTWEHTWRRALVFPSWPLCQERVRNHFKQMCCFMRESCLRCQHQIALIKCKWNQVSLKDLNVGGEDLTLHKGLEHGRWDQAEGNCTKPHDVYQRSTRFFGTWGARRMCATSLSLCLTLMPPQENISGGETGMVVQTRREMGRILVWQICQIWHRQSETCAAESSLKFLCSSINTEQRCGISSTVCCHQSRMVTHLWIQMLWHKAEPHSWGALREGNSSTLELVVSHWLSWGSNAAVPPKALGWKFWVRSLRFYSVLLPEAYC